MIQTPWIKWNRPFIFIWNLQISFYFIIPLNTDCNISIQTPRTWWSHILQIIYLTFAQIIYISLRVSNINVLNPCPLMTVYPCNFASHYVIISFIRFINSVYKHWHSHQQQCGLSTSENTCILGKNVLNIYTFH